MKSLKASFVIAVLLVPMLAIFSLAQQAEAQARNTPTPTPTLTFEEEMNEGLAYFGSRLVELEQKVERLEKRIEELEAQLADAPQSTESESTETATSRSASDCQTALVESNSGGDWHENDDGSPIGFVRGTSDGLVYIPDSCKVIEFTTTGDDHTSVWAYTADGDQDLLVNAIGTKSGVYMNKGYELLEISTNNDFWLVTGQ